MRLVLFRRLGLQMLQSGSENVLAKTRVAELQDQSLRGKTMVNMTEREKILTWRRVRSLDLSKTLQVQEGSHSQAERCSVPYRSGQQLSFPLV